MDRGKVIFFGDGRIPYFDLEGTSVIDNVEIHLWLKGTTDKPSIKLTSEPPLPEEGLLVMLLTGRQWKSAERALREGQLSLDVAREFIDYFFFGGSGNSLFKRLGIKQISLEVTEEKRALVVGAEYSLSKSSSVALEGKKELRTDGPTGQTADDSVSAESVTVEYSKKF